MAARKGSSARAKTKRSKAQLKTASSRRAAKETRETTAEPERFWLDSDITSDRDVERDTFGSTRLAKLKSF